MKKDSRISQKIIYILNNFELYLATYLMIIMTILLFVQVVSRYVLDQAIVWTEEFSIIAFVWVVYLGISASTKEGGHIRIDLLPNALPPKYKKMLLLFTDLIVIAFCLYAIPPLINITSAQGTSTSVMLKIPLKLAYGVLPFGLGLTAIRGIQSFIKTVRTKPDELSVEEENKKDSSMIGI